MISKLHNESASTRVARMLEELFDIYEKSLHALFDLGSFCGQSNKATNVRCDAVSGMHSEARVPLMRFA